MKVLIMHVSDDCIQRRILGISFSGTCDLSRLNTEILCYYIYQLALNLNNKYFNDAMKHGTLQMLPIDCHLTNLSTVI